MIKVLIAEQSYLIRKGLTHVLNQFNEISQIEVLSSHMGLNEVVEHLSPDILIINSTILNENDKCSFSNKIKNDIKIIHLINTILPSESPNNQISIYDTKIKITDKLSPLIKDLSKELVDEEGSEELTQREQLILKHVALGLTNKEIASKLYISSHTVISHRKNITRKLKIKSVSGLTVYAILNGIIKMSDIS
ncbi:LuxR C-terminal-related transcriptional regulator [Marinilabiliaceae bacterium ANBcel2]|nr:LuxR C-terminal-related transcriptional regulator [Marinilabiliaceae bacterium ANBcel2]